MTPETLPTFTPAIRTAWFFWIGGAFSKVAFSSYGFVNGMSFVNARKTAMRITTMAIRPAWKAEMRLRATRLIA